MSHGSDSHNCLGVIAAAFAPVLACAERATGTTWRVEHTGGGCHCLTTDGGSFSLMVTFADDAIGCGDSPEGGHVFGWAVGAYWYPTDGNCVDLDFRQCSSEELPLVVRDMFAAQNGTVTA